MAALEGQGQDRLFDYLAGERRPGGGGEMLVGGKPVRGHYLIDCYPLRRGARAGRPRARPAPAAADQGEHRGAAVQPRRALGADQPRRREPRCQNAIERLSIDTRAQRQARRLSGGNQQKLTIARWLAAGFTTMLCFDPTRGIESASSGRSTRCCGSSPRAAPRSCSSPPSCRRSSSSATARRRVPRRGHGRDAGLRGGRAGAPEGGPRAHQGGGRRMSTVEEARGARTRTRGFDAGRASPSAAGRSASTSCFSCC